MPGRGGRFYIFGTEIVPEHATYNRWHGFLTEYTSYVCYHYTMEGELIPPGRIELPARP